MAEEKLEFDPLYDEELVAEDKSGNARIAQKAKEHVLEVFDTYRQQRNFRRGGKEVCLTEDWDQRYRIYKAMYLQSDHSYEGVAQVFNPELRKAVNVIDSEADNALFGRDDYFSVEPLAADPETKEMTTEAFGILKYYSDQEDYPYQFSLAKKQAFIYDTTWVEAVYDKNKITGVYREKVTIPLIDEVTGEPVIDPETGQVITDVGFRLRYIDEDKPTVRIEVRDIYRMYVNHLLDDPEKDDIVYRDSMTAQQLLELSERGVYNKKAVDALLRMDPSFGARTAQDVDNSGDGKTMVDDLSIKTDKEANASYEVLRFQGLFTTKDESSGRKIRKQFWIDIGEREHCLRCIESPVIGGYKTFSGCNYDSMVGEFNSDSVISPYTKLQFQMNDKENQSLDGLTFNLNGPVEVLAGSGIKASDLIQARKQPNKVLFSKIPNSVNKITVDVPLTHLNNEQIRLQSMIQSGTGATSLASGAPSGTQVDRSGKAVDQLLNQTRSQFSRFVRKFEKRMIERSMQKVWDIIIQFFDDEVLVPVSGPDGVVDSKFLTPTEVVGQYRVRVSTGSQYLKERQYRDRIVEFLAIAGTSDIFMQSLDSVPLLQEIARSLDTNLERFINPDNLITKQQQLIQQLNGALEATGEQNKDLLAEAKRLQGELKQTDRSSAALPGPIERQELATN